VDDAGIDMADVDVVAYTKGESPKPAGLRHSSRGMIADASAEFVGIRPGHGGPITICRSSS